MNDDVIRQAPFRWSHVESQMKEAFGDFCTLISAEQIHDGLKKKVYRLNHRNPEGSSVLVVWHDHSLLSDGYQDDELVANKRSPELFRKNTEFMTANGIPVPEIFRSGKLESGPEYALVQSIDGGNYGQVLSSTDTTSHQHIMERVSIGLQNMHSLVRNTHGPLIEITVPTVPYADLALQKALMALDTLGKYHQLARQGLAGLRRRLEELRQGINQRSVYRFIHGNLSPENILIDRQGQPYFIGLENAQFADLEQDYSQLSLRFGSDDWRYFWRQDLDEQRLRFYNLCSSISLASVCTLLLTRGYSNIQEIQSQLNFTLREALKFL
jgi:serine/threonine protein kinase